MLEKQPAGVAQSGFLRGTVAKQQLVEIDADSHKTVARALQAVGLLRFREAASVIAWTAP